MHAHGAALLALAVAFEKAKRSACMKRDRPPMKVSSISVGPPNLSKLLVCIARRMRWSMNHAVF
jgi:hypothetical protein